MPLEPIDIINKEFSTAWRGYTPREVNQFLEQVADRMQGLKEKLAGAEAENSKLHGQCEQFKNQEGQIKSFIETAKNLSEKVHEEAHIEASRIKDKAREEARQIRATALEESDQIRREQVQLQTKRRTARERLLRLAEEIEVFAGEVEENEDGIQNADQG